MYSPKTPTDVLKNQAGIDGNERVSIERALEEIIKMMPKEELRFLTKKNLQYQLGWVDGHKSVVREVHQIFKGGV